MVRTNYNLFEYYINLLLIIKFVVVIIIITIITIIKFILKKHGLFFLYKLKSDYYLFVF